MLAQVSLYRFFCFFVLSHFSIHYAIRSELNLWHRSVVVVQNDLEKTSMGLVLLSRYFTKKNTNQLIHIFFLLLLLLFSFYSPLERDSIFLFPFCFSMFLFNPSIE